MYRPDFMISFLFLKAFYGNKSPLYQQITHFSFQFMENDLFGRIIKCALADVKPVLLEPISGINQVAKFCAFRLSLMPDMGVGITKHKIFILR